jgi:hypothetical protein
VKRSAKEGKARVRRIVDSAKCGSDISIILFAAQVGGRLKYLYYAFRQICIRPRAEYIDQRRDCRLVYRPLGSLPDITAPIQTQKVGEDEEGSHVVAALEAKLPVSEKHLAKVNEGCLGSRGHDFPTPSSLSPSSPSELPFGRDVATWAPLLSPPPPNPPPPSATQAQQTAPMHILLILFHLRAHPTCSPCCTFLLD